ncbi:MAG TPA: hypothetical protein VGH92_05420 [Gaiellaceae bacterium]
MRSELERRLAGMFGRLPRPGGDVESRARAAALAALPAAAPARTRRPRALVLAVALVALLVGGAAALAASGTVSVTLRAHAKQVTLQDRLALPAHANGVAAVIGGRLWLATRTGAHIEGVSADTEALSPHAYYVAAGIGRSLVAMAPHGREAWTKPTAGVVVAIAWAPSGLRIAYIVRRGRQFELRTIEGDGDHDRLVDAHVRPVRPSWRADSLALSYVGAGGRIVVIDWRHGTTTRVASPCAAGIDALAFAPSGDLLDAISGRELVLVRGNRATCSDLGGTAVGFGWLSRDRVAVGVVTNRGSVIREGKLARELPGRLISFTADSAGVLYATRLHGVVAIGSSGPTYPLAGTQHALRVSGLDLR